MNSERDDLRHSADRGEFRRDLEERLAADPDLAAEFEVARERASLGLRIARLRQENGLSQAALADRINTTQSVISRYESADYESYNLETLRKLAKALGAELNVELRKPTRVR